MNARLLALLTLLTLCGLPDYLSAQGTIFPGLDGEDLKIALRNEYTPNLTLSYAEARDTLYSQIDVQDDTIYCIYTQFPVYLTPGTDPTVTLFEGGINTEHIYPQGRGATDGTDPYMNMYNLAASRADVNQDRANLPFAEINDNDTDSWYYLDIQMSSIPGQNIDSYSEKNGQAFEPKENVKGDIARSIFYIYTMYEDQVNAVDDQFFPEQIDDLCTWHFQDPVDDTEAVRNNKIAQYQGELNPFIEDCTLPERLYCQGVGECLTPVNNQSYQKDVSAGIDIRTKNIWINNNSDSDLLLVAEIYTLVGQLVESGTMTVLSNGKEEVNTDEYMKGVYLLVLKDRQTRLIYNSVLFSSQ